MLVKTIRNYIIQTPRLYKVVRFIYYNLHYIHIKRRLLGTRVFENEWAYRHEKNNERNRNDWGYNRKDWISAYWDSRFHPHRYYLLETISKYNPTRVLEIGCNCGPNLFLLAKRYPNAEIVGIDINSLAIEQGRILLAKEGILNVKLLVGKADDIDMLFDESFDVIFTDGVLIYIGPDKINDLAKKMVDYTEHALILMEWHCFYPSQDKSNGQGLYHLGYWIRDYKALFRAYTSLKNIKITKISHDIWPERNWEHVGALIELMLQKDDIS